MPKDLNVVDHIVFVCNGGSCLKKGAEENTNILRAQILHHEIHDSIHTIKTRCTGQCVHAPVVFVHPDNVWYEKIDAEKSRMIVDQHLVDKTLLKDHVFYLQPGPKKGWFRNVQSRTRKKLQKLFFSF